MIDQYIVKIQKALKEAISDLDVESTLLFEEILIKKLTLIKGMKCLKM
jgi:hypothetical protein